MQNLKYVEDMPLKCMEFYSLLLSCSTREPNCIYKKHLQAELIGASPIWITRKTTNLFTCLGGSSQSLTK